MSKLADYHLEQIPESDIREAVAQELAEFEAQFSLKSAEEIYAEWHNEGQIKHDNAVRLASQMVAQTRLPRYMARLIATQQTAVDPHIESLIRARRGINNCYNIPLPLN